MMNLWKESSAIDHPVDERRKVPSLLFHIIENSSGIPYDRKALQAAMRSSARNKSYAAMVLQRGGGV